MILDIVVLLIFASSVFFGWRKGFVKTILGLFGMIVALIISYTLYKNFASFIMTTPLGSQITNLVERCISGLNIENLMVELPLPQTLKDSFAASASGALITATTNLFITVLSLVSIFFIVMLGMKILDIVLSLIVSLPVISAFDKLFGIIFGVLKGGLWVYLIILACTAAIPFFPALASQLNTSLIVKLI